MTDKAEGIDDHGLSVSVGADGTWVCMRTESGKHFCFQPIQEWPQGSDWHVAVKEWCMEMASKADAIRGMKS